MSLAAAHLQRPASFPFVLSSHLTSPWLHLSTLLGITLQAGSEMAGLREGLQGKDLSGLDPSQRGIVDVARQGGEVDPERIVRAFESLTSPGGAEAAPPLTSLPAVRLAAPVRGPAADLLILPKRGGVIVRTSEGLIQFGVPMWTNKDVYGRFQQAGGKALDRSEIPRHVPTIFIHDPAYVDPDRTTRATGLLPFEYLGHLYFVLMGTPVTLVAPDQGTARRLKDFLDLSYRGDRRRLLSDEVRQEYPEGIRGVPDLLAELERGFQSPEPEVLRTVVHFDDTGSVRWGQVKVRRLGGGRYEIYDQGRSLGVLDLGRYPPPPSYRERKLEFVANAAFQEVYRGAVREGRVGLWPFGTSDGWSPDEETSGFMIWNRGRFLLVDPPSSTWEYLLNGEILPPAQLEGIVITHGHTDHFGNAITPLLEAFPRLKIYTTRTIRRMLQEQYRLALGSRRLKRASFVEVRPQTPTMINGLDFVFDYTFHTVPTVGFEIRRRGQLLLYFSGDTYADFSLMRDLPKPGPHGEPPVMSHERAFQILRHYFLVASHASQKPPPVFLIEGGIPPIHLAPELTRAFLEFAQRLGIDTSRVFSYHTSDESARTAGLKKWRPGHEGWIDLS